MACRVSALLAGQGPSVSGSSLPERGARPHLPDGVTVGDGPATFRVDPADLLERPDIGAEYGPDPGDLMPDPPTLLDLYCGSGGACGGYMAAGWTVHGVDLVDHRHDYPGTFHQGDALEYLADPARLVGIDAVHASPPCQAFTHMSNRHRSTPGTVAFGRIDLLTPTLELMRQLDIPWVVENVSGSAPPLRPTLLLHGGMFDLGVHRPRLFESNVLMLAPRIHRARDVVGVYGRTHDGRRLTRSSSGLRAAASLDEARVAMGMDWADWQGTKEAVPPAYTEWIGAQLLRSI